MGNAFAITLLENAMMRPPERTWRAACASTREETRPGPEPTRPEPAAVGFALQPASFNDLPGWANADLAPALTAFRRACDGRRQRDPSAALPGGGRYGGTVGDWAPACEAARTVAV